MSEGRTPSLHRRALAGLLGTAFAGTAFAQEPVEGPALELGMSYTGDLRRNTTGGLAVGTAYSEAIDLGLAWRTAAFGARVTTNLAVMYMGGDEISAELTGDLQGLNSIEAASHWRLYESWVEFGFGESSTNLRAGVLDLNAEFDTPVTQALFTGSPFGIGTELSQTGLRGPVVWPVTGLGLRAAGDLGENFHWRGGAYDGAPGTDDDGFASFELSSTEGALLIGEVEYASARIHKFSIGAWAYTADFERIDAALNPGLPPSDGNHGFYSTFDLPLGVVGDMAFDGALRAGVAPDRYNAVDQYVGAALTVRNFWAARPGDQLGLGIAWAHLGRPYRDVSAFEGAPAHSAETLYELVYRAEVAAWLVLIPNVQFVNHPGATQGVGDSWVAGLRFALSHGHSWPLSVRRRPPADGSYARREH
jgi:porin